MEPGRGQIARCVSHKTDAAVRPRDILVSDVVLTLVVSSTSPSLPPRTLSSRRLMTATSGGSCLLLSAHFPGRDSDSADPLRIWKSNASAKIAPMSTRERQAIEYRQKLVDKWSSSGDVRAVKERRHVPASVHNTVTLKRDMIEAQKVKEDRRRKHTRAGKEKPKAERKSESNLHLDWFDRSGTGSD